MISFQARYILPAVVMRQESNGYKNTKVSFVELDAKNYSDLKSVKQLEYFWSKNSQYIFDICDTFADLIHGALNNDIIKIFALTAQKSDFDKLDSNKILGLVEFEKVNDKVNHINYIQTGKNFSYYTDMPEYKYVGSTLLDKLKERYPQQDILLLSAKANDFYKKNGFENLYETAAENNYFLWRHR